MNDTARPAPKNAITWFEIPAADLQRAERFYGAVLGHPMQHPSFDGETIVMFPSDGGQGVGGCLVPRPASALAPAEGTLVYLDVSPSLDAALARVKEAGGDIAHPRTALPAGMGFYAHIVDSEGNRVGLHAEG